MVRNFPRTTRRRVIAALAACSMLMGVAAVPLASADDLKDKKAKVERKMSGAHDDLEESSARLRAAASALAAAQGQLDRAQAHLSRTRGELAAAEALDRQMQAKLDAAIARLAKARQDLDTGRQQVADQEHELGRIVVANYQTGDPALMGLSMVLTTQNPEELTGQLNSVRNIIDKEAVTLSRLEASKVLLTVQEQEVEEAKAEVAEERKAAAENLVRKQELEKRAEAQEMQVANLVSLRANAQSEAEKARNADMATLQSLEKERDRIAEVLRKRAEEARRRAAAAAAAAPRPASRPGRPTPTATSTTRSPARSPRPSAGAGTRSTATGRCTTASTSVRAAAPRSTRRPTGRSSTSTSRPPGATASSSTTAGSAASGSRRSPTT